MNFPTPQELDIFMSGIDLTNDPECQTFGKSIAECTDEKFKNKFETLLSAFMIMMLMPVAPHSPFASAWVSGYVAGFKHRGKLEETKSLEELYGKTPTS